ncbi:Sulfotransferase 1C4 [Armadillidium vulgare]|nr:Sulfotransferase 1C4 [Armadillidium vulgare]
MSFKSGHRIIPLVFEEAEKVKEHFRGYRNGTIRLDPDGWFLTTHFITFADKFFDFKFKRSDVVIMTYPKCGSTWVQEIVWNMLFNPNFDNPEASLPITIRSPFLDLDFIQQNLPTNPNRPGSFLHDYFVRAHPNRNPNDGISLQFAELAKDPRIIKTHLSFPLLSPSLPEACKFSGALSGSI